MGMGENGRMRSGRAMYSVSREDREFRRTELLG